MPREMTEAEVNRLRQHAEVRELRPSPPIEIGAAVARAVAFGVGVIMFLAGVLVWTQAPMEALLITPLVTGVTLAGAVLILSTLPTEKIAAIFLSASRLRQIQKWANDSAFRKEQAYLIIQERERTIEELQRAIAGLRDENMTLRAENQMFVSQTRTPTYVTRDRADPDTRKRAEAILQHWFSTLRTDAKGRVSGQWWSRDKATKAGWSQDDHEAAVAMLKSAEIVGQNGLLPFVMPEVSDLADAMYRLDVHYRKVNQEPPLPRVYVEPQTGGSDL